MRSWLWYAAVGLALALAAALLATAVAGPGSRAGVWFAAVLAYLLQLAAFGALVAVGSEPHRFLLAWGGGMLLRFTAFAGVGLWLSRSPVLPLAPTLLSLVAFMVLLVLLEPVFLRERARPGAGRRVGGNQGAS